MGKFINIWMKVEFQFILKFSKIYLKIIPRKLQFLTVTSQGYSDNGVYVTEISPDSAAVRAG